MNTTERDLVLSTILGHEFRRATFAGTPRGEAIPWLRVIVRPLLIRGTPHLQFAYFDRKKCITKNAAVSDSALSLSELLAARYSGIHVTTVREEIDIRTTKKGQVHIGRRPRTEDEPVATNHNRIKDVPLPEGRSNSLLEAMGILTHDGQVRPTMRAKFTQVNEFLKHFGHVVDDAELRSFGRPIEILDCGCGSSYLTLAAHHFLNDILQIPARITGVDVNEDVIRKSAERAARAGAPQVNFSCGSIQQLDSKPDVVFALHACDTATDDAIARAVHSNARLLLSVPCCHKNLNRTIRPDGEANVLRPILRHNILQQRTADLVTDSFRALALRIMGYKTDVVEFVSTEHTARNLMIRAVLGQPVGEAGFVAEYLQMKAFWGVTPYLEDALGDVFTARLQP